MPDWFAAIVLGIVEGITEFLPVSSTGHLIITERVLVELGWLGPTQWLAYQNPAKELFNIVIQCGAVSAVLLLFPHRMYKFFYEWRRRETQDYLLKLFTAFFITGAVGYELDKRGFHLPEKPAPIAVALLAGGVAFLAVEYYLRGKKQGTEITWTISIAVAFGQLLAGTCPGTSRSGATIIFCLLLGLTRPAATEFSFLVGIPTMLAAGGWKIFETLRHPASGTPPEDWQVVMLATLVSAVVSFVAVKWLLTYVQTHTFEAFGYYRIGLAVAVFLFLVH